MQGQPNATSVEEYVENITLHHPLTLTQLGVWCSWLSHSLSMREVPGSIPVSSISFFAKSVLGPP